MSVAAQLPISLSPSSSEIVFCPESNSYALSVGVTVQLPITELVEVLLKFNSEHMNPEPKQLTASHQSHSLLASLPDASPYSFPDSPSVYTPRTSEHAKAKRSRQSNRFADDEFLRIPLSVARQDGMLIEYRERSKWRRESGKFFRDNSIGKEEERIERLNLGFKCYDELLVNEHFMNHAEYESFALPTESIYDSQKTSTKLNADAPIFTPGSAFASTYVSDTEGESIRQRAMSESISRDERSVSLSYLPPSALSVMEEKPEEPVESVVSTTVPSPTKQITSFWNKVVAATADDIPAVSQPDLDRDESRPVECKQM
jgi:hypothetical protein